MGKWFQLPWQPVETGPSLKNTREGNVLDLWVGQSSSSGAPVLINNAGTTLT